jgi:hypothetical protein
MKRCKYCGKEAPDTATRCTHCGGIYFTYPKTTMVTEIEGLSLFGKLAIIFLILAFAYVIIPFDAVPESFFDDVFVVVIALSIVFVAMIREPSKKEVKTYE